MEVSSGQCGSVAVGSRQLAVGYAVLEVGIRHWALDKEQSK